MQEDHVGSLTPYGLPSTTSCNPQALNWEESLRTVVWHKKQVERELFSSNLFLFVCLFFESHLAMLRTSIIPDSDLMKVGCMQSKHPTHSTIALVPQFFSVCYF